MKRQYYVVCKECGGEIFKMVQELEAENDEDWYSIEMAKALCHPGFGWELEDFTMVCVECGKSNTATIKHRDIVGSPGGK